jgi:hypothetical protein
MILDASETHIHTPPVVRWSPASLYATPDQITMNETQTSGSLLYMTKRRNISIRARTKLKYGPHDLYRV